LAGHSHPKDGVASLAYVPGMTMETL